MHGAPTEYRPTKAIQDACTLQWLLKMLNAQHGCSHDPCPTYKAQTACKKHGHQWQSNLSTRPSRTLRMAKEGCIRRTSQQLQQCGCCPSVRTHDTCGMPCTMFVRCAYFHTLSATNAWRRALQQATASIGLAY